MTGRKQLSFDGLKTDVEKGCGNQLGGWVARITEPAQQKPEQGNDV